ncbi:hypothetical protein SteCoe_13695 [Stentor coeruleus]|uniref:Protein phosphatase inhibitor 2 n=1 Tax=Stentor coeruleus TaxID=5963 RepID=A0A1R2C7P4_9CILI|nr:hypothetical protein SteCoe_13695 [Stentor coeruleus]
MWQDSRSSESNNDQTSNSRSGNQPYTSSKDSKTIKWDEEGISEHDKTRGTRMKITEPKTPYNYYNEEEDLEVQGIDDALPKLEKIKKKQQFEAKRKNHYNEYEMMRKFREHHRKEEEDEEEDD